MHSHGYRLTNTKRLLQRYLNSIKQATITDDELAELCDIRQNFRSRKSRQLRDGAAYSDEAYRSLDAIVDFIVSVRSRLDPRELHEFVGKLLNVEKQPYSSDSTRPAFMGKLSVARCFLAYEAGRCREREEGLPIVLKQHVLEQELIRSCPRGAFDLLAWLDRQVKETAINMLQRNIKLGIVPFDIDPFFLLNPDEAEDYRIRPLRVIKNLLEYKRLVEHGRSIWRNRGADAKTKAKAFAIAKLAYVVEDKDSFLDLEQLLDVYRGDIIQNRGHNLYRFFCGCCSKQSTSHGYLARIEQVLQEEIAETPPATRFHGGLFNEAAETEPLLQMSINEVELEDYRS